MVKNTNDQIVFPRSGYTSPTNVARFLGISRPFLYRLMNSGQLRYTTIAGMRRIPRVAVHELVENNMTGAST